MHEALNPTSFCNTKNAVFTPVLVYSMPGDTRSIRMFDKIVLDIAKKKQRMKLFLH